MLRGFTTSTGYALRLGKEATFSPQADLSFRGLERALAFVWAASIVS